MKRFFAILLLLLPIAAHAKEKVSVRIIQRQDSDTNYNYVVPGFSNQHSTGSANCYGAAYNINCSGTAQTTGFSTPARSGSFSVHGATLSLLLPDGRTAVVNCQSKYAPQGNHVNRRSCRTPFIDDIQAEFNGNKAKLEWVVSLDGKKTTSETYKILAVLDSKEKAQ